MRSKYLVTGGTGFLGSALVRRLVQNGCQVRVFDNDWRGRSSRLADLQHQIEFVEGDIRDADAVVRAVEGIESVCHLASVNGTRYFYTDPDLVLDVGVRGIVNIVDACKRADVPELVVASSSEVYHLPPRVPTDEDVPLVVPDPRNPRYSYATTKLLNEVMLFSYGRRYFERAIVFRPHNVYGPDMGWEHVIPEFALRMVDLPAQPDPVAFPIQGTGRETRAFVYIDDFIDGLLLVLDKGQHLETYHIGTTEELAIADVARAVARQFDREIRVVPGEAAEGGTSRRCPDIGKLRALGYKPRYTLDDGLPSVVTWYRDHAAERVRVA
jgi:nucleoside-diphosphate-sugar epimerase